MAQETETLSLMGTVLQSITWTRLFGYGFLFILASFLADTASQPRYPKELPWMGRGGGGMLAKIRNGWSFFTKHRSWIQEGYRKYGQQDMAFVAPASIARPDDIILPRSQIAWMMEQPDHILSADRAHSKILHLPYNFLGHDLDRDNFGSRAMHKYLARHLPGLIPDIEDEVNAAVTDMLGTDTENWQSVNLWNLWMTVVPRVTNRLLVGKPVCRDDGYLKALVCFTDAVIRNSFLLNMFPTVVHPIVGRLVSIPNWMHWKTAYKLLEPLIKQRLHDMEQLELGNPEYKGWVPPEDFITWDIRLARAEQNPFELDPAVISKRTLPVQFAAIHTTALTGQSLMLDLLSTKPGDAVLDTLRDELLTHRPPSGHWTKAGLASLTRLDSAIRESQRLSNFAATLVERQVVAPEGLYSPALGCTIPRGAFVTVNLEGTHHDHVLYPNPRSYDPWRYSRIREEWDRKTDVERDQNPDEGARARGLGMVTTSDSHLVFGHGRHACPGRFFVAHELKLIMAAMLLNYDMKLMDYRPQPQWFGATIIPPLEARVEVRRKKGTA